MVIDFIAFIFHLSFRVFEVLYVQWLGAPAHIIFFFFCDAYMNNFVLSVSFLFFFFINFSLTISSSSSSLYVYIVVVHLLLFDFYCFADTNLHT